MVDFGCAEGSLLLRLKRSLIYTRQVIGVDKDEDVLKFASRKLSPIPADYFNPREFVPMDMHLMQGSVAEYDARLENTHALSAIEM